MNMNEKLMNRDNFQTFASNNDDKTKTAQKINIQEIQSRISDAHNCMSFSEEAIILLGDTDAGKSTVANLLAGIPLKAISMPPHGLVIDLLDPDFEDYSPIGHNTVSQTINPKLLYLVDKNTKKKISIWDAPGFGDTRGPNIDIPNCYMIKTLFLKTKRCKIVFVVSESSLNDHNKSRTFMKRVDQILQIFWDVNKIYQSVFLAVTRVRDFASDANLCQFIQKELIDIHPEFKEKQRQVLQLFTDERRVLLFQKPTQEGQIPKVSDVIYQKFHTFPFSEVGEVSLALSSESLNVIKAMSLGFMSEINDLGQLAGKEFVEYTENIIKNNDLSRRIEMISEVKNDFETT